MMDSSSSLSREPGACGRLGLTRPDLVNSATGLWHPYRAVAVDFLRRSRGRSTTPCGALERNVFIVGLLVAFNSVQTNVQFFKNDALLG